MTPESLTTPDLASREIVVNRILRAPRDLVWQVWTDPQQVTHWWGPEGFRTTTQEFDLRPGGTWRFVMHGPDGRDYPNRVVYDEVVAPSRLVYTHAGDDPDVEPVHFQATILLDEHADGTRLTMRMVFPTAAQRERVSREYGAVEGALQTVARLAEHLAGNVDAVRETVTIALPSEKEIILRRVLAAPAALVFEAFTKPEHIRNWWGCGSLAMSECQLDFRLGGSWRFVLRTEDGEEHPFTGVFQEIVPGKRIVQTFIYDVDGIRDFPAVETITFEERDGRTILTNTVAHGSQEARDGHLNSGMEDGAIATMDRLESYVADLARTGAKRGAKA